MLTTDPNVVIEKMLPLVRQLLGSDFDLRVDLGDDLVSVASPRDLMEQVVQELAVCARDASPSPGWLRIESETTEDTLDRARPKTRRSAVIRIRASWDGEPLAVEPVTSIARRSGGDVLTWTSERELRVEVHWKEAKLEPAEADARAADAPVAVSETILLADDEEPVREFARIVLERNGYRVLIAQNGAEAIRVSRTYPGPIHLMLADVVMPELGGPEAADKLHHIRPDMRVLFLSGYSSSVVARDDDRAFGRAYLQKPFTMDALSRKVREVLDR